ncbi:hypothetical protein A0H76_1999 [Hepatospora eriocheir]|uniref:Uncharacterized protein n=1 Tax=Hepatospora eriocheir TaxID=1081669 RepID=A0A1X0QG00_9MICR|nr:hypothetical protein A0H76_1999 [Hepatospora eriocheir]
MMHYVRPDFIKKAFHSNRFTNFLEHHDILWNHLYNDDKNIVRKMKSISECKEVFFRKNSIIDNIKQKSNYPTECTSLVTCQRDMTMLKVVKVDNKYKLFTTSTDATIRYFEVSENEFKLVSSYLGHSDSIWALDADKNVIVSGWISRR